MPDLFDTHTQIFDERYHSAAVAGTAFVVARHCTVEAWTDELGGWCIDVLERAATGPEGNLSTRVAVLWMHPAVFAAHGYSALLARGYQIERCQKALLSLAVDALQGVQNAVFASAKYYAAVQVKFYWLLLDVAIRQCIVPACEIPDLNSIAWEEQEAARKLALLERADSFLAHEDASELPTIPMPWIKSKSPPPRARRDTQGYARNDTFFLHDSAGQLLRETCLEPIVSDAHRRSQFLKLVGELLQWTVQEIVPPFAKSRRDHDGHTPFKWVSEFSAWCGELAAHLPAIESRNEILAHIWAQDTDTALLMMQSFMRAFMIEAFLVPKENNGEQVALWSEMAEWLFSESEMGA
jgi:hypothetical protein